MSEEKKLHDLKVGKGKLTLDNFELKGVETFEFKKSSTDYAELNLKLKVILVDSSD